MKKIAFISLFLVLYCGTTLQAQFRLNGYVGYLFDDSFDSRYSNTSYLDGKIKGGLQWGIGAEYLLDPDYGIELVYYRQDTEVPVNYYRDGPVSDVLDMGINYIMLGGVRYLQASELFQPYGGLMLGMAIYDNKNPEPNEPSSATKFAWGIRLGSNIWISERIGLKVQGQLLSAVQGFGGGFYFGTGGTGAGVNTYSTLLQFGLGGGVTIKLGGEAY
jgi:hypothetical protein